MNFLGDLWAVITFGAYEDPARYEEDEEAESEEHEVYTNVYWFRTLPQAQEWARKRLANNPGERIVFFHAFHQGEGKMELRLTMRGTAPVAEPEEPLTLTREQSVGRRRKLQWEDS